MTFCLFPTLCLIHICVQVHLQCNHTLAGGAHTYRINIDEQNVYIREEGKRGSESESKCEIKMHRYLLHRTHLSRGVSRR